MPWRGRLTAEMVPGLDFGRHRRLKSRAPMLTLINANRMNPPIAPIGLDYVATAARRAGLEVDVLDLGLVAEPELVLASYFAHHEPDLVGISFRNVDDCFWPSATSFVPDLARLVARVHELLRSPVVLGGVGFSVFAPEITATTGAEFGIRGDGEGALVALYQALTRAGELASVPGLIWRSGDQLGINPPAWPEHLEVPTTRDAVDNRTYFARGGQAGVETKRGCPAACIYCADPVAKGKRIRLRSPRVVADEFESLAAQGITVVHLCDGEFNLPRAHALGVAVELAERKIADRVRWYTYAAVVPFDAELARAMRRAGCIGIDFTGDSAEDGILGRYRQEHRRSDLERAVRICREEGITCMVDLLLGGPGETPATVRVTIDSLKELGPDSVGASLGMRLYPETPVVRLLDREGPWEENPSIRRRYTGPVDLLRPTFYLSHALGDRPATLVRELIGGDQRFFAPAEETPGGHAGSDHNYNDHRPLTEAIARGARGAYWDILRQIAAGQA
jgi:tryptophan 2-C-methyltransferase